MRWRRGSIVVSNSTIVVTARHAAILFVHRSRSSLALFATFTIIIIIQLANRQYNEAVSSLLVHQAHNSMITDIHLLVLRRLRQSRPNPCRLAETRKCRLSQDQPDFQTTQTVGLRRETHDSQNNDAA